MTMLPARPRRLTEAEAAVLTQHLPAGLTEEVCDVAYCLFEATATMDSRCGAARPDPAWLGVLHAMARIVTVQVLHLCAEKGGKSIYLPKGVAAYLSARDLQMCSEFTGNNYDLLARRYELTEMRVRQIVNDWQKEQFRVRQGRLPGIDD